MAFRGAALLIASVSLAWMLPSGIAEVHRNDHWLQALKQHDDRRLGDEETALSSFMTAVFREMSPQVESFLDSNAMRSESSSPDFAPFAALRESMEGLSPDRILNIFRGMDPSQQNEIRSLITNDFPSLIDMIHPVGISRSMLSVFGGERAAYSRSLSPSENAAAEPASPVTDGAELDKTAQWADAMESLLGPDSLKELIGTIERMDPESLTSAVEGYFPELKDMDTSSSVSTMMQNLPTLMKSLNRTDLVATMREAIPKVVEGLRSSSVVNLEDVLPIFMGGMKSEIDNSAPIDG